MENAVFTNQVCAMLAVENPNYDEVRRCILQAYNRATGATIEENIKSSDDRLIAVVGWLNDLVVSGNFNAQFLGWKPVGVALFSPDLSSKVCILSQFHCPLCNGKEEPIGTINLRLPPMSYQNSDSKAKLAYKRIINQALSRAHHYGDRPLCIHIVFIINKKRNRIDVDNMAKLFLDGLQGAVLDNDNQIDHLNLHKFTWEGDDEHISVNIRQSNFNRHEDVLYHEFLHSWAGAEELRLEDFMDEED